MKIEVWSDGSATTPNKPGGYGWVMIIDDEFHSEGSGYMPSASNNDAELNASLQGLIATYKYILGNPEFEIQNKIMPEVTLVSDSQLILGWVSERYRFKQTDKIEKFNQLNALVKRMNVKTRWVKGHSGNKWNDRCDKLANDARKQVTPKVEVPVGNTKIGNKKNGIICVWHQNKLKVIDLISNIVEDYSRELHGARGSMLEIREEKSR